MVRLCEALSGVGCDTTLASLNWNVTQSAKKPSFSREFQLERLVRRLGCSREMKKWLYAARQRGVNVIHNHGMWQMNAIYPAFAAKRSQIPFVSSPRGALSSWAMSNGSRAKWLFWSLFQRRALDATTCFHATAENEYEDIRARGFKQPIAVIPNGIDIPQARVKRDKKPGRTLLYLGRIHPKKGLENLLRAWERVGKSFPDWSLRIVGRDDNYGITLGYTDRLKRLAADLRLERIAFAGERTGNAKTDEFCDADIFVLPTFSENFGLVVAESLAMGTPVVVTHGAPWNGVVHHNAGWYIDIGVDPLVSCLTQAFAMRESDLIAMGNSGRQWMLKEFAWSDIGAQMREVYLWLLNSGRPVPPCVRLD
ncbi:MAG: glycosyltransferase [Planctomycetales bacterium]|nr:glycosyltransferase [Planctomycetales bacterium]